MWPALRADPRRRTTVLNTYRPTIEQCNTSTKTLVIQVLPGYAPGQAKVVGRRRLGHHAALLPECLDDHVVFSLTKAHVESTAGGTFRGGGNLQRERFRPRRESPTAQ